MNPLKKTAIAAALGLSCLLLSSPLYAVNTSQQKAPLTATQKRAAKYYHLSQNLGSLNKPKKALEAIDKALALEPNNVKYLAHRSAIGYWTDNIPVMINSNEHILKVSPNNASALLGMARANVRAKKLNLADDYFVKYLKQKPDDKNAILEHAQLNIWSGHYKKGKEILALFHQKYGETVHYRQVLGSLNQNIADSKRASAKGGISLAGLRQSVRRNPRNAKLRFELSKAYSGVNDPKRALRAINGAVRLQPNNITYLKQRGMLAYWNSDIPTMDNSYARILKLRPNDAEAILGAARAKSGLGQFAEASDYYARYIKLKPQDRAAYLAYASVEIWQENFRKARTILAAYKKRFGNTVDYRAYSARLYASAFWYDNAFEFNNPLLKKQPKKYYYLVTQTIAYKAANRNEDSLRTLGQLTKVQPKSEETQFMNLYVKTPLRSSLTLGGRYLEDSQNVHLKQTSLLGNIYLTPSTRLLLSTLYERISATKNSGVRPVTGGTSTHDTSGMIGLFHQFSTLFSVVGNVGALGIHKRSTRTIFDVGTTLNFTQQFSVQYEFSRDLFRPDQIIVFSPKSVSLAIMQNANMLHVHVEPMLQRYLDVYGTYTTLSDNNAMKNLIVWPTAAIVRRNTLKLDLGVQGELLAFNHRVSNGYYSPKLAQLYLVTLYGYYGISQNMGLNISMAAGVNKDETFHNFYPSGDITASFTVGIYKDWQLVTNLAYSYRGNPTNKPYQIGTAWLLLTRRF
jgi:Tfp pilus assembly protein PilF